MAIANRILNIFILLMAIVAVAFGWKLFERRKELRARGDLYADSISKAVAALDENTNAAIGAEVKADDAGAKGPLGWPSFHEDFKATKTATKTRGLMDQFVKHAEGIRTQRDALSEEIRSMSKIFEGIEPEVTVLNDPTQYAEQAKKIKDHMILYQKRDAYMTEQLVAFVKQLDSTSTVTPEKMMEETTYIESCNKIMTDIKYLQDKNRRYSDALSQSVAKLGGEARLGVTPDGIREVKPADVESMIKGIEKIMDTVREVETLRVQIKTVEEQLAKAKDDLDRANEEIAQQLIKIESLKKLNEGQKVKITKLENRIRVIEGRTIAPGQGGRRYDGLVKKVNYDFNYIIINIGGEEKLIYGTQLTIARDREFICNVMVTKVYKKFAVAEILPENKQGEVLEGDRVLSLD